MRRELITLISGTIRDLGAQQDISLPADLDDTTVLFGQNGVLDSMGLVSAVVAVEQAIEDRYGATVSLADARAMSQKSSPYRTIGSLADYALGLMQEGK
jgi:acyl carrier protein